MRKLVFRNGRSIGDGETPYIVAELNSSHNGNVETAKQMILSAKECGCDCVKFQSWSAETLYCDEYYRNNPISRRIVDKFSLSEEQLTELSLYCKEVGIDFSSTPYSVEEVDYLVDVAKAPFVKISSMEINNLPFLKYIAEKDIPIVLSTGMSTLDEIETAVQTIEEAGNKQICILHCVSVYPAEAGIINLNNLVMLKERFPDYVIGYSDHTIGSEVAAASVALGASLIEKHFTLDRKKMGMDNSMATEPKEMAELVVACRNVYSAMGTKERVLLEGEEEQRLKMRRSLVVTRDVHRGEKLTANDIEAKRPGNGIPPADIGSVVGKTVTQDIPKGYQIKPENIE
jgi:N-acetylneuraminate synthase